MSATALRSVTADRVPENWCRQAAHETESTMIRLALTVLPLAPAHPQQVRAALHYPQAKCRLHDISSNTRMVVGTVHSKKTPRESFDRGKNQVLQATKCRRCPRAWRSRADDNSPMWLNAGA